jgi:hypothetical protein
MITYLLVKKHLKKGIAKKKFYADFRDLLNKKIKD